MKASNGFDGFDLKIGAAAWRQIAVNEGEQTPDRVTVARDADFVDDEGHQDWVDVIKKLHQQAATSGGAASGNLANGSVLRGAREILYARREKDFDGLRIKAAEQADHFNSLRDCASTNGAAQKLHHFFAEVMR